MVKRSTRGVTKIAAGLVGNTLVLSSIVSQLLAFEVVEGERNLPYPLTNLSMW